MYQQSKMSRRPYFTSTADWSIQCSAELCSFNSLSNDKFLDWSKLKEFADGNLKFDENSRKFSKQVENTVGKGEIACYEQFLLFPQCFQKACFQGASKCVIVWEWVNSLLNNKFLDWSKLKHLQTTNSM